MNSVVQYITCEETRLMVFMWFSFQKCQSNRRTRKTEFHVQCRYSLLLTVCHPSCIALARNRYNWPITQLPHFAPQVYNVRTSALVAIIALLKAARTLKGVVQIMIPQVLRNLTNIARRRNCHILITLAGRYIERSGLGHKQTAVEVVMIAQDPQMTRLKTSCPNPSQCFLALPHLEVFKS